MLQNFGDLVYSNLYKGSSWWADLNGGFPYYIKNNTIPAANKSIF